ncbi:hypothetical protein KY346_06300 [Candidatus Woesearchaeota archaeon]|nr:hypothetical protein [Candidatus Woesearchaeota archaeon]
MKLGIFEKNKSIFLVLGIITGFVFIVAFSALYVSDAIQKNNACGCVIPIPYMILILSSLGIFVGSAAYYFTVSKYVKEGKARNENINYTLNFLEPKERKIIKELIKDKSGLKQADLERRTGFHKVKIHRIISRLLANELIEKENHGKINKIRLNPHLKDLFE